MSNIIKKIFDVYLDICHNTSTPAFTVVQGDTGTIIKVHMTDSGKAIDFTDCFIQAVFLRSDGASSSQSTNNHGITVTGEGEFEITLYPASIAPGTVECEIQIFSDVDRSTLITSSKFTFDCRKPLFDDNTITASANLPILVDLISDVKKTQKEVSAAAQSASDATDKANLAAEQCKTALSAIPSDLTPAFLKTLSGSNVVIKDAQKGSKIQKCIVYGNCIVSRPDESLPVSSTNINKIQTVMPSAVTVSYGEQTDSYGFESLELAGIPNFISDEFDFISGQVTYFITHASFTGNEAWSVVKGEDGHPDYYVAPLSEYAKNFSALICSHFPNVLYEFAESVEAENNIYGCCIMQNEIRIRPNSGEYETLDEFVSALKSWEANKTPLTVYYELLQPQYSNKGNSIMLIPASESESNFTFSTNALSKLKVTYCCDMNVFMNNAPIGTVLKRINRSELGFGWETLTAQDVGASPFLHAHGNITTSGAIGTVANRPVITGEKGVITTTDTRHARELLEAASIYDISSLKQLIPYVSRRVFSTNPTLKNINYDRGILSLKLCGFWSSTTENDALEISPENIASIAFFKPTILWTYDLDNNSVIIPLNNMPVIRGLNFTYDTFDALTGKLEINIASLTLTGDEDWELVNASAPYFKMTLDSFNKAAPTLAESACTHFESVPYTSQEAVSSDNTITGCCVHDDVLCIRPKDISKYSTLNSWKAFLSAQYEADTPVTVYYQKEAPDIMGSTPIEVPLFTTNSLMTDVPCFIDVEYAVDATKISRIEDSTFGSSKTLTSLKDGSEYHLGRIEKLTIPNEALPDDHYSVLIYFDSIDSISVSVPASIRWAGGTPPNFSPNKTYEISIKDGLGKVEVYDK